MKTILFVCTGNTCRSPMAAGLLKHLLEQSHIEDIQVASAGLAVFFEEGAHQNAIATMEDLNIDISQHRARQADEDLLLDADLILTMTQSHRDQILAVLPQLKDRVFTLLEFAQEGEEGSLDIRDPYALPKEEYQKTAQEIEAALKKALPKIIKFFSL